MQIFRTIRVHDILASWSTCTPEMLIQRNIWMPEMLEVDCEYPEPGDSAVYCGCIWTPLGILDQIHLVHPGTFYEKWRGCTVPVTKQKLCRAFTVGRYVQDRGIYSTLSQPRKCQVVLQGLQNNANDASMVRIRTTLWEGLWGIFKISPFDFNPLKISLGTYRKY